MAEPNVTAAADANPTALPGADKPPAVSTNTEKKTFPASIEDMRRMSGYNYFEKLFLGEHYDAFNLRVASYEYNKAYSKLRYVMANFAGLISKVVADMLFSEPITLLPTEGDQEFVKALWDENNLDIQCYESALSNSYEGDALFKVRVGKRHPNDSEQTVIIEDTTPKIYFPVIDPFNTRAAPLEQQLSWVFKKGEDRYLRKEIHQPGIIKNEVWKMDGTEVKEKVSLDVLGISGIDEEEKTGIDESLVIHIPNWKVGSRVFGLSDYYDLDSLFYAVNNRMTKIDNILDKHSDPILLVPEGVLDEDGKVKKGTLGVVEVKDETAVKPSYVVWDASLENAFKQVEKLIELMYMIGEVSPDVLGLGTGVSDSGRALKFKLMRTIAKVTRKKLYYYVGLRKALYVAQLLAKENNISIRGKSLKGEATMPDIKFADGLPIDESEQIEMESAAIDAGITTEKDAMMRVYNLDEATADKKLKEIQDARAIALPKMNPTADPFKKDPSKGGDPK